MKIDYSQQELACFDAIRNNDVEKLKEMLEKGEINAQEEFGDRVMINAAFFGDTEIVKIFLDNGARIDAWRERDSDEFRKKTYKDFFSVLMSAELNENVETIKLLLEYMLRPNLNIEVQKRCLEDMKKTKKETTEKEIKILISEAEEKLKKNIEEAKKTNSRTNAPLSSR